MSSQRSFQSIIGKFSDGITVLKGLPFYSPAKPSLKIDSLTVLKTNVETKNSAVITIENSLKELRDRRKFITFKAKGSDENCIENLIRAIANYIKSENNGKHPAYLKIMSILSKLKPPSKKNEPPVEGQTPKNSISKSEKSYQSLVGFVNDVLTIITNLGVKYSPANVNITVESFKARMDELVELNANITTAEGNCASAIKERAELYKGDNGINEIIISVKDYLSSLEGGRNNSGYIAFCNAVK